MLLFTPGPTPVIESVRQVMALPTIHHRTPEFEAIFGRARELLFKLYGMHEVLILASTGTGAMEAAVINITKSAILTVNAGKFGERFGKIARAHGHECVELKYEWDTPASVDEVIEALKKNENIDSIAIQISESAGGLRHPVEQIAKAVKEFNSDIMVIADGITALGVEPLDTKNIDVLISGSQKALMLPPGIAMLGLSEAAIERIGSGSGYYLNLASEIKQQRKNTTAYTAATTLIMGLVQMLEEIDELGFDTLFEQTQARAEATRAALEAIGLQQYAKTPALSMTTIVDENASEIRTMLKNEFEVNVAGGQDHLKGLIFRINHMGLINVYDAAWVVNAIELALDKIGRRTYDGTATKLFSQNYYGK